MTYPDEAKIVTGLGGTLSRVVLDTLDGAHLRTGAATVLAAPAVAGGTTIQVTGATGISIGDVLKIGGRAGHHAEPGPHLGPCARVTVRVSIQSS